MVIMTDWGVLQLHHWRYPWARLRMANTTFALTRVPASVARSMRGTTAPRESLSWRTSQHPEAIGDGGELSDARGYKLSYLAPGPGTQIHFRGLFHGSFTADERAVCERDDGHQPPVDLCTCGFYAFGSARRALTHWPSYPDTALLTVEMYGDIVAHQYGWRAEEQVVVGVLIRPTCIHCGHRADGVSIAPPVPRGRLVDALGEDRFAPTCRRCVPRVRTLADISGHAGTEVSWAW